MTSGMTSEILGKAGGRFQILVCKLALAHGMHCSLSGFCLPCGEAYICVGIAAASKGILFSILLTRAWPFLSD